jgi:peptidoglycan/LPS O-acetylase OafA/YrhL
MIIWSALVIAIATYFYLFNGLNWTTMDFTVTNGIYRCCGGFFAGVFLFQVTRKFKDLGSYLTNLLEIISVGLVIFTVSYAGVNKAILFSVIPVFTLVVFAFSQEEDGLIGKLLQLKPFAEAGKYSYSIYLSHAIILDIGFSLAQYLFIKPGEVIYFYQSDYSFLINVGLVLAIFGISKFTYLSIEKTWIDKSKRLVVKFNEFDESQLKKASVYSLD